MANARTLKGSCPQGQHKCGTVVRGERICGMPGHGASQCRAKISPWRGPAGEAGTSAGQDEARPVDRVNCQLPRMADLYAGPNTPLSKAFIFCGWETISVDWMLDSSHDLSNGLRQQSLHEQLQSVCFIAAALDCSTKSRAREIPRDFGDGRPPPRPLRSEKHPLGLPELTGSQLVRVEQDNAAASFVLSEIDQLVDRGGGSVRENPYNSLHWWTPDEVAMWESGRWSDQRYSACCFGGARAKLQRLRHNIAEIAQWPRADCNHFHDPQEWEPWVQNGKRHFPSAEESEYTAELCFAIATAASWWAVRVGHAKLYVPRSPSPSCTGHRDHWLDLDPRALREWAMTPLAISLGLRPLDTAEAARVPTRACVEDVLQQGALPLGMCTWGWGVIPTVYLPPNGSLHGRLGWIAPLKTGSPTMSNTSGRHSGASWMSWKAQC